ncbi:MAG: mechanosensitive ion channel [Bacteroidetes bacterium]|jgi:small conductance mechanosensitive channel|nr:mechanosensitive ion channel [Bacteroidota bacterium]
MEEWFNTEGLMDQIIDFGGTVVLAIVTLIIGFWIAGLIGRLANKAMQKREVDDAVRPFLVKILKIALKIMVLISVAGIFGIKTASFIAVLGAATFALGLALQGTLGHFASGVLILIFKPYKVGDAVEVQGALGVVQEVSIFNTIIHTFDNQKIILPNGIVTGGKITNISTLGTLRVEWNIGIGYEDDIDKARSIIRRLVEGHEKVLKDEPIDCFLAELADSSVNFKVRCWTKTEDKWAVYFDIMEQVKKNFDAEGVSFPFPQMDVHMDKLE